MEPLPVIFVAGGVAAVALIAVVTVIAVVVVRRKPATYGAIEVTGPQAGPTYGSTSTASPSITDGVL